MVMGFEGNEKFKGSEGILFIKGFETLENFLCLICLDQLSRTWLLCTFVQYAIILKTRISWMKMMIMTLWDGSIFWFTCNSIYYMQNYKYKLGIIIGRSVTIRSSTYSKKRKPDVEELQVSFMSNDLIIFIITHQQVIIMRGLLRGARRMQRVTQFWWPGSEMWKKRNTWVRLTQREALSRALIHVHFAQVKHLEGSKVSWLCVCVCERERERERSVKRAS